MVTSFSPLTPIEVNKISGSFSGKIKKIEAQTKKWFPYKKDVYFVIHFSQVYPNLEFLNQNDGKSLATAMKDHLLPVNVKDQSKSLVSSCRTGHCERGGR